MASIKPPLNRIGKYTWLAFGLSLMVCVGGYFLNGIEARTHPGDADIGLGIVIFAAGFGVLCSWAYMAYEQKGRWSVIPILLIITVLVPVIYFAIADEIHVQQASQKYDQENERRRLEGKSYRAYDGHWIEPAK